MKKLALILFLGLSVAGCAQLQAARDAANLATASITNPVTPEKLDSAEAGLQLVFAALNTYRRACVQGIADLRCKDNIRALQKYTRAIPPFLNEARKFVDQNDQINAVTMYNTLIAMIADLKQAAVDRNVTIGEAK